MIKNNHTMYIDSRVDSLYSTGSSTNFSIKFQARSGARDKLNRIAISHLAIPRVEYQIKSSNKVMQIDSQDISLGEGIYDIDSLAQEIQNRIQALGGNYVNFNCVHYSSSHSPSGTNPNQTGKLLMYASTGTNFTNISFSSNSLAELCGFKNATPAELTFTNGTLAGYSTSTQYLISPNVVNLHINNYLYLICNQVSGINQAGSKSGNVLAALPIHKAAVFDYSEHDFDIIETAKPYEHAEVLDFKIVNEFFEEPNFNGITEVSFTLHIFEYDVNPLIDHTLLKELFNFMKERERRKLNKLK